MSEANLFAEKAGFTVHFKLTVDEPGPDGIKKMMANTELFIDWMKAHGYEHDKSRDRGFPGKRPQVETPPPPGLTPPTHCDQPAQYKPAYQSAAGNHVGAKWECRNRACPDGQTRGDKTYPWSKFLEPRNA